MSNDHLIHSFKFDLNHLSKQNYSTVEDRVVRIFNQSFYSIINRLSDRFTKDQEVILDQLVLDLGGIPHGELEQQLPLRFERALKDYFEKREKLVQGEAKSKEEESKYHPLVFYLIYGIYPWYAIQKESFSNAWQKSISDEKFVQHLYQLQWPNGAIKRLIQIGYSSLLDKTLKALVPDQADFILNYHQELLEQQERKALAVTESRRSFHYIIWEFTLEYILNAKGSRFSKKQFVTTQISGLTRHYNIRLDDFLKLFFQGIIQVKTQNHQQKELYAILTELKDDFLKEQSSKNKKDVEEEVLTVELTIQEVERILLYEELNQLLIEQLRHWLIKQENLELIKQHWLNPLKEKLLYASVEIIVGKEGHSLVRDYHELLWNRKTELKKEPTVNAYKEAVWRFTLDFFYKSFSSYFQAKVFVQYHSKKIAQHYNFNHQLFLGTLVFAIRELAVNRGNISLLSSVLLDLHEEEIAEQDKAEIQKSELIDLLLDQMIKGFDTSIFHSELESYLFIESWAIRILKEIGRVEELPINFLLQFLEKKGNTPMAFLKTVQQYQLTETHTKETEDKVDLERYNRQLILQWLSQMIREFETSVFHSEREIYFFLEGWGIRIIDEMEHEETLPISILLNLLQKKGGVDSSFLKTIRHHQQYELKYTKKKFVDDEVMDLSSHSIQNYKEELSLRQFVEGKKELDYHLLLKLLWHEEQLSSIVVERLRTDFKKEKNQSLLLQNWVHKLNNSEINRLILMLFGSAPILVEMFKLIQTAVNDSSIEIGEIFLIGLFESEQKGIQGAKLWEAQLTLFSRKLTMKRVELERKVITSILKLSLHQIQYLGHYYRAVDQREYFGSDLGKKLKSQNRDAVFNDFLKLQEVTIRSFTAKEIKEWNDFFLHQLLKEPEALMKRYFSDSQFREVWNQVWKQNQLGLSSSVQQLFLIRQSQWKNIRTLVSDVVLQKGTADRFIQFVIRFEESNVDSELNFSTWKKEEIYLLLKYLQQKKQLEAWIHLKRSIKIDFLKQSKIIEEGFFMTYYLNLEKTYGQLPANHKPYSFYEFELTFWRFIIMAQQQQWSVWQFFEKWMLFIARSLKVNILLYGQLEHLIPPKEEGLLMQLKEKLQKEQASYQLVKVEEKMEGLEKEEVQNIPELALDKWELYHVGLVILHPFLKQLLTALEYLDEKHQFKNEPDRTKGILVLHYLATGENYGGENTEEHELAFPKLVCGMPISGVIDNHLQLDSKELEMADGMLSACIQHWDKLKGSSIDTLRNTFLKRNGRIEEKDSAYQLFVESSGTDILLDSLPWSISLIRLPWLEQPIYVSWR